ncbi:hypothetical protein PQX77_016964 [Marasmius sp. AFHP31]|nr:hypothetical protein PQX77_016964 [Marasmius sp. AFHP31]
MPDVLCALNVQHDCDLGECTTYTEVPIHQERSVTSRTRSVLDHSDTALYILNTHSLHNQSTITQLIPSSLSLVLSQPTMSPDDQIALWKKAAAHIRNRKAQGTVGDKDSPPDTDILELLPFEHACGRGGGRGGGGGGGGGGGHKRTPAHGRGRGQGSEQQQQDLVPLPANLDFESFMGLSKNTLVALCKQYLLRHSGNKTQLSERLVGLFASQVPSVSQPTPEVEHEGIPTMTMGPVDMSVA